MKKNILFYFGHPAQYLFLRATIRKLILTQSYRVIVTIKSKDVLEDLLTADGINYINILPRERGKSKFLIFLSLLKRIFKLIPIVYKNKPNLLISTDSSLAIVGFLFRINRITITEDDYEVIKSLAWLTYPFTNTILCPEVCNVGRWNTKKTGYLGYMKLGYLHPAVFTPDKMTITKYQLKSNFIIIRLAKLTAHHDFDILGLSYGTLDGILDLIKDFGISVYISAEGDVEEKYNHLLLCINPEDMHHILAGAELLICDSQSMTVEAAMLGVPSIRVSDFSGRISVLEELEKKYELTFGIKPNDEHAILKQLKGLLKMRNRKEIFQKRRVNMLSEKINVTEFLTWFIQNYPKSKEVMFENSNFQNKYLETT